MEKDGFIIIGIALILIISLASALLMFFHFTKQQQMLHRLIIRSQNEKEIETYTRIAGAQTFYACRLIFQRIVHKGI